MLKRSRIYAFALLAALVTVADAHAQTVVPPCPAAPPGYEQPLWEKAWQLHHRALVVDTHVDTTSRVLDHDFDMGERATDGHFDLPRARQGGLDAVFYSIYVDARFHGDEASLFADPPPTVNEDWPRPSEPLTANGSARRALGMIDGLLRTAGRHPDQLRVCTSVAELRAAVGDRRHAALMGIEGGHAIEGDLALLRLFHQLGVRYMTLTHTNHNQFADSCAPATPRWGGLNQLGVKVVEEMNRLGVMVDISHVSDATFFDVLDVTSAPPICSHSSMRALCAHPRNITDDMLRALAAKGGVMMVNYNCGFIDADYAKNRESREASRRIREKAARDKFAADSEELRVALERLAERTPTVERPSLDKLVAHVLRAVQIAGADHVGLGSDFDGVTCVPQEMDDVTFLPRLTYKLLAADMSEADVRKVLGENIVRVLGAVEQRAYAMRNEPPRRNDAKTDQLPRAR